MTNSVQPWFRDDVFWSCLYPFLFDEARMSAAEDEAEALIALVGGSAGRWVDLGCGPGRHAVALAARGVAVTGVDASAFLLERARARAAVADLQVDWLEADLYGDAPLPTDEFDVAISMFTTFGYGTREDDARLLAAVRRSLRAGGRFVIELAGKESVAAADEPTRCDVGADGALLFQRHWPIEDWTRMDNHWVLVEGDRASHFRFSVGLYAGSELRAVLLEAGFDRVDLHSDLAGASYAERPERLIAVAGLD